MMSGHLLMFTTPLYGSSPTANANRGLPPSCIDITRQSINPHHKTTPKTKLGWVWLTTPPPRRPYSPPWEKAF